MFDKNEADKLFKNYGLNQKTNNADTNKNTAKAFSSSEYIGSNRNRLNSGILRNQFILLLDPLNEKPLSNATFSGVSQLRDDQYVLVSQSLQNELWDVYKGNNSDYPRLIKSSTTLQSFFDEFSKENIFQENLSTGKLASKKSPTLPPPTQTIYYGVPGCGKSHSVDKEINAQISAYNADKNEADKTTYEKQVIRTVFHPDYCNADFIGQIVPQKSHEGENKYGIKYEFKPGPLATILRKAYLNPGKPYFLVIEEINRGNAAAIFGETFQLLDRYQKNEHSKSEEIQNEDFDYTEGWSKYSVNNDEMNEFILKGGESNVVEKEPGVEYDSDFPEGGKAAIKIPSIGLHFSTYCGIRLPPNLSFYATMNTSDQNVFTLDNAFQRRWEMKLVPNGLNDSAEQYNRIIKNGVKWGEFRERINEIIMEAAIENGLSSMEDKRLGGWFYTKSDNFAEKVLKYLWDDAFKFDRTSQFGDVKTLEELIENFNEKGFSVFKADSISSLQNNGAVTDE